MSLLFSIGDELFFSYEWFSGNHTFVRDEITGSRMDEAVKRIKVEKPDDELVVQPSPRLKHEPEKLRFLEGLGLVTVDRKKGK